MGKRNLDLLIPVRVKRALDHAGGVNLLRVH